MIFHTCCSSAHWSLFWLWEECEASHLNGYFMFPAILFWNIYMPGCPSNIPSHVLLMPRETQTFPCNTVILQKRMWSKSWTGGDTQYIVWSTSSDKGLFALIGGKKKKKQWQNHSSKSCIFEKPIPPWNGITFFEIMLCEWLNVISCIHQSVCMSVSRWLLTEEVIRGGEVLSNVTLYLVQCKLTR